MSDPCPKKVRDRKYCLVLYPDDPTHVAAVELLQSGGFDFAAILHDKDPVDDNAPDGELKKPHWHIVVRFKNAVFQSSLAKQLGIAENYLQPCKNLDGALCYLVHYGNDEKFQYDYELVFGSLKVRLATLLADTDESTRALNIYDFIRNAPGVVTYTEIFEKACKAGLYGDFRRMGSGVSALIRDHNSKFDEAWLAFKRSLSDNDGFERYLERVMWVKECPPFEKIQPFD